MEPSIEYTVSDYVSAFRRRRGVLLFVAVPIIFAAMILSMLLADVYTSSAQIDINLEGASANTLEPIEVSAYADQYIGKLTDQVLRRENLLELANNPSVIEATDSSLSEAERVDLVGGAVKFSLLTQVVLSPITGRETDVVSGVSVAAEGHDPDFAFAVARNIVQMFLEADRSSRTERASSTSRFLDDQMSLTDREIVEMEAKIADFKVDNACCLPELVSLNTSVIERAERDLASIRPRIRALEQDKAFLQRQLDEIRQLSGTTDRIEELEQEYTALVANYGPDHPDVIRMRRQIIAMISAEKDDNHSYEAVELRMQLVEAEQKYSSEHPDVIRLKQQLAALEATKGSGGGEQSELLENPRYLQVRTELNSIQSELTQLRASEPELREKIRDYEERLRKTPQVESEYQALIRRLESVKGTYEDLQRRAVSAQQSEALESTDIAARLQLIKAPALPRSPSGPPRAAIVILGFFLAGTLGVGSMLLAEMTDSTVRDSKDVVRTLNIVPLATIPVIQNVSSLGMQRRRLFLIRGALALLTAVVIWFYFFGGL